MHALSSIPRSGVPASPKLFESAHGVRNRNQLLSGKRTIDLYLNVGLRDVNGLDHDRYSCILSARYLADVHE